LTSGTRSARGSAKRSIEAVTAISAIRRAIRRDARGTDNASDGGIHTQRRGLIVHSLVSRKTKRAVGRSSASVASFLTVNAGVNIAVALVGIEIVLTLLAIKTIGARGGIARAPMAFSAIGARGGSIGIGERAGIAN